MYERVYYRPRGGDSELVASELPLGRAQQHHRRSIAKRKLLVLLLGNAFFLGACASDSADDTTPQHHRRRGSGHGRDQTETVDRSDNPSPTPALGW
ncbi:MAG TPA: hypothetical protein VGH00_09790 [Chthoniobacterales bacterium]